MCELCGKKKANHLHHLFSQTKLNKKLYPDFIHDVKNLMLLCYDCHLNKKVPKFTEIEFCRIMAIEPRSKTGKELYLRHHD
jgi:5-methylcytosine-specific restriction endonuclease McrA